MIVFPAPQDETPATNWHPNEFGPWIVQRVEDVEGEPGKVKVYLLLDPLP
jgi:hypothetical protein